MHDLPTPVNGRVNSPFCEGLISVKLNIAKIKPSQKYSNLQYSGHSFSCINIPQVPPEMLNVNALK